MPQQATRPFDLATRAKPHLSLTPSGSSPSGAERTYDELYEEARKRGLKGRSKMSKTELERALGL
jgi:hypothetical protein